MSKSKQVKPSAPLFQVKKGMAFFIDEPCSNQGVPCNNGIRKSRPYLVVSNDLCNAYSNLIQVIPLKTDHDVQAHSTKWYFIQYKGKYGSDYIADVSSIMLVDKIYCNQSSYSESNTRNITEEVMDRINDGIIRQFGLDTTYQRIGTQTPEVSTPITAFNKVNVVESVHNEPEVDSIAEVETSEITETSTEVVTDTMDTAVPTPAVFTAPDTLTIKIDGMDELVKSFAAISSTLAQHVERITNAQNTPVNPAVEEVVTEQKVEQPEIEQTDTEREVAVLEIPLSRKKRTRRKPFTHEERMAFLKDYETMKTSEMVEKYAKYGIDTSKKAIDAKRTYMNIEGRIEQSEPEQPVNKTRKKRVVCVKFPENDSAIKRAIEYYEKYGVKPFIKKYKKYGFSEAKHVYNFVTRNKKRLREKEKVTK